MVRILEVKDKTGRLIYLTDERYKHIKKHPEFRDASSVAIIEQTIKNPIKVKDYSLDHDVKYYYSYHKDRKSQAKSASLIYAKDAEMSRVTKCSERHDI